MSARGRISIKDNVTCVLKSVKKEQTAFRKDVYKTKKAMQKAYDKKRILKIETAPANKAIKRIRKKLNPIRKKLVKLIAIKDMAKGKINKIKAGLKALSKFSARPIVKLKNKIGSKISKIKSKLAKLKSGIKIPIAVGAIAGFTAITAGLKSSISGGMTLEKQKISMEHFIGATNKDMDASAVKGVAEKFTSDLRENANVTPFETGEIMKAGSRAIAIASGNTKEAMGLVKLAEDMAAASGGTKTVSDAIEALADAKMGETERLKEFGFKVGAKEFDKKGFSGVTKDLNEFYGGASEKLSKSGAGILSTIRGKLKSNFSDFGLKLVEKLKPMLSGVVGLIDKYAPKFDKFGTLIANGIMKGVDFVQKLKPIFNDVFSGITSSLTNSVPILTDTATNIYNAIVPTISSITDTLSVVIPAIIPVISTVVSSVSEIMAKASPVIAGIVSIIGSTISTLAPTFRTIFDQIGKKVGVVLDFVASKMGFIHNVFDTVVPIISDILVTSWGVISPVIDIAIGAFKVLWSVVEFVFPAVKNVIESVWHAIKPVVEGISKGLDTVAKGWEWLVGKVTGENARQRAISSSSRASNSRSYYNNSKQRTSYNNYYSRSSYKSSSYGATRIGKNELGTDNWRGGLTLVGEKGAELVDLPKGSRILPNKTSARLLNSNYFSSDNNSKNSRVDSHKNSYINKTIAYKAKKTKRDSNYFSNKNNTNTIKKDFNSHLTNTVIGKNELGTNNWKGGLTLVGEKGVELVDLPKGSRILPNKTSARLLNSNYFSSDDNSKNSRLDSYKNSYINKTIAYKPKKTYVNIDRSLNNGSSEIIKNNRSDKLSYIFNEKTKRDSNYFSNKNNTNTIKKDFNSHLTNTVMGKNELGTNNWKGGLTLVGEKGAELVDLPKGSRILPNKITSTLFGGNTKNNSSKNEQNINITIPKLADTIIVREESDIDKIGEKLVEAIKLDKLITA